MPTYRVSLEVELNLWRIAIGKEKEGFADVVLVEQGRCVLVSSKRALGGILEVVADDVVIENGVARFVNVASLGTEHLL